MPQELLTRFERDTGMRILEGYGLTEGGCVSTLNPPAGVPRPGSIGIRLPWQQLRVMVLDAEGRYVRDAAPGQGGTIAIQGPNVFEGYLNVAHNRNLWIDVPGSRLPWLNTGDLGRIDEHGQVWLTGRSKELIIRAGHNIDPKMIEEPMHQHPSVALAAAVGRPDAHAGEVPCVYVQLRPGATATNEELLQWGRDHIAERAAWPKHVEILACLPTTAVGKIFKPALVDMAVRSVMHEEALAADAKLGSCDIVRESGQALVVRWDAPHNADALAERLARFTFRTERA
jgi:acyl-CoA synthetase (AMP-forming)/AMP-acid ligase II